MFFSFNDGFKIDIVLNRVCSITCFAYLIRLPGSFPDKESQDWTTLPYILSSGHWILLAVLGNGFLHHSSVTLSLDSLLLDWIYLGVHRANPFPKCSNSEVWWSFKLWPVRITTQLKHILSAKEATVSPPSTKVSGWNGRSCTSNLDKSAQKWLAINNHAQWTHFFY